MDSAHFQQSRESLQSSTSYFHGLQKKPFSCQPGNANIPECQQETLERFHSSRICLFRRMKNNNYQCQSIIVNIEQ